METSLASFNTSTAFTSLENVKNMQQTAANGNDANKNIHEKAKELEAQFLSTMIEPMFSDDSESGVFGGGAGNDVYKSLMISEYGKLFSQAGGIGLAESITRELLALQEV